MPRKRNNPEPPPVMTWKKASPVLGAAAVFDLLRIMFEQFWFFGPAILALYCTTKVSGVVGATAGGWACSAVAAAAGVVGFAAIEVFGIVMAMAVGFAGWLVVGLFLVKWNPRIFKENATNVLWFGASLLISEVPIVGTLPALTGVTYKLYRTQIANDRRALAKYGQEQESARLQEKRQQDFELMQLAAVRQAQEAANDAQYEQAQAANDERYTQKTEKAA